MRVNFRKVFLVGVVVAFLWLLVTYSSIIEMPKTSPVNNNVVEIESRIDKLQQQMKDQISDSSKLLKKVQKRLKKVNSANKEDGKIFMPGKYIMVTFQL